MNCRNCGAASFKAQRCEYCGTSDARPAAVEPPARSVTTAETWRGLTDSMGRAHLALLQNQQALKAMEPQPTKAQMILDWIYANPMVMMAMVSAGPFLLANRRRF